MHCPFCLAIETKVIDSRLMDDGQQVKRRRCCLVCSERFTTFETAHLMMPKVIKQDGTRQAFDERKLRDGMARSFEKRSISVETIEKSLNKITSRLRAEGEREVHSTLIGQLVMEQLKELDQVAYIRFASVYRDFQDASDFGDAIASLESTSRE